MFGRNYSDLYYAISGNNAGSDTVKIVFLLSDINPKQRKACGACVKKYGGQIGDIVPMGAIPVNMFETGELYMIGGYGFLQETLNTLSVNIKIELYLAHINECDIIENKPVIRNAYRIKLLGDALSLRKKVAEYYLDNEQQQKSFPLTDYFDIEPISQPLYADFKTILHVNDYTRRYNKNFFFKSCLNKRVILRDVDVARPATSFGIEDEFRLALALAEEENQLRYFRRNSPSEAGAFITHHKNVVLSFVNQNNEPEYIFFNKDYIDPEEYKKELYDFVSLYMNKVNDICVKSPVLVAMPHHEAHNSLCSAVIYNGKILPVGISRLANINYSNIYLQPQYENLTLNFHSQQAMHVINNLIGKLKKSLPFYYYGINYMTNAKNEIVIVGIKTLKMQDMGLIASFCDRNRSVIDKYFVDNPTIAEKYNICDNIGDNIIVSQMKDLMMGYARNNYLERFAV